MVAVLKEAEAGAKTADICRKHGVSSATFYACKSNLAAWASVTSREPEEENRFLKRLLDDSALEIDALKLIASGDF